MDWRWTLFALFLNFQFTCGSPAPSYDLFQGSAYTGVVHRHRNRYGKEVFKVNSRAAFKIYAFGGKLQPVSVTSLSLCAFFNSCCALANKNAENTPETYH